MRNYKGTHNVGHRSAEDDDVAIWAVLYADPLYDLRNLRLRPTAPQPSGTPPAEIQLRDMAAFAPSASSRSFFDSFGLAELLDNAVVAVTESAELRDAATTASADPVEHRQAIARANVETQRQATRSSALAEFLPMGWNLQINFRT